MKVRSKHGEGLRTLGFFKPALVWSFLWMGFILLSSPSRGSNENGNLPAPLSLAKAAELGLHRLDRLVALHRVQAAHLLNLDSLTVAKFEAASTPEIPPHFLIELRQVQLQADRLEISLLLDGSFLKYRVIPSEPPTEFPNFQFAAMESAALVLGDRSKFMEEALHFVFETAPEDVPLPLTTQVGIYDQYLSRARLDLSGLDAKENPRARVILTPSTSEETMEIPLLPDGSVVPQEVKIIPMAKNPI